MEIEAQPSEMTIQMHKTEVQTLPPKPQRQTGLQSFFQVPKPSDPQPIPQCYQVSLQPFLQPAAPKQPFQPIDVVRPSIPTQQKKRGRPRKFPVQLKKKVKSEDQNIEEVIPEDTGSDQDDQPQTRADLTSRKKRGPYNKLTLKDRKEILEKFDKFLLHPYNDKNVKISFNEFCYHLALEKKARPNSIKKFCLKYRDNPSMYTELQILCSNDKKASRRGNIKKRISKPTYSQAVDQELYDWIIGCLDIGLLLTRDLIQEKAREMITPTKKGFVASDSWLDCFLRRFHLFLRKMNEKSIAQNEINEELSRKFVLSMGGGDKTK